MADKYFSKNSYINDKDELINELVQKKSALKGRPAALFRFFLDHPRRIYSKDDLLDELWPEGGGSYEGIYVHLNAIKSALKKIDEETVIASRYGHEGIRANSIHPSTVYTPLVEVLFKDPERKAERLGEVPLGRLATAEDVANAVLYLASEEASFINGVSLPVDGGVTCY